MLPHTQTAPRLSAPVTAHGDRSGRLRLLQQLPLQHGRPALLPVAVAVVVKGF